MRRWISLLFVALALAWAAPALALEAGEFALAPQLGMVTLPGSLGGLFAADFGYGAGVAYGITDLIGLEADFIYSVHQELDRDETGPLDLVHFVAGIGPRFNWQNRVGVLYLGAEFAMAFLRYQARWPVGDDTMSDDNSAHGFGGALSFGGDFFVANGFTIGLSGRAGGFASDLEYRHLNQIDGQAGTYGYLAGLLRFTLLF